MSMWVIDTYFQCYNWERKALAALLGVGCSVGLALGLVDNTSINLAVIIVLSIMIFAVVASITFVMSTESFWATPCDLFKKPSRIYSAEP